MALAVASSGIAATLLTGGRTFHSRFKAPLQPDAKSVCSIKGQSTLAEVIHCMKLIIWDEAPMAHYHLLEALDRTLRDLIDSDLPFGGKVIVLGGDFRQILPVMKRGSHAQIVAACAQRSLLWHHFQIFHLRENMRLCQNGESPEAARYGAWLLDLEVRSCHVTMTT